MYNINISIMSGSSTLPITIHHYRNITQTTQHTSSIMSNNPQTSSTTRAHQKLKKIMNKLQVQQKINADIETVRKAAKLAEQKNSQSRSTQKIKHTKSHKLKNKYLEYEPILSSRDQSYQKSKKSFSPNTSQERKKNQNFDERQITFGQNYYPKNKNHTQPNSHQKKDFDLISKRDPEQVKKLRENQLRKKQYWENVQKNQQNQSKVKFSKQSTLMRCIRQAKAKNPGKYAVGQEIGLTDEQIYSAKGVNINFQLQKFTKNKGSQYMKQISLQTRIANKINQNKSGKKHMSSHKSLNSKNQKNNSQAHMKPKYPDYIHEVFPKINSHSKVKTKQKDSQVSKTKKKKIQPSKQYLKYMHLNDKQQMLGKYVLQKVKDHFKLGKQKKKDYLQRVKSEQIIDDALVQYLRTKMDRADIAMSYH